MTLSQSLVEVRTITSDLPRSNFDEQKIEQAARLIIEAEGIINPIVVNRTGINSFKVLDGHFEYHAAARARELNLEIGEAIAAYIIEGENEAIKQQIEIFRNPQLKPNSDHLNVAANTGNLETRFNNFESRIETRFNELKNEYSQKHKDLKSEIESLKNKLPEQIEPLTTFNQADVKDLTIKLKPILRSDTKANTIAQNIVNARPFSSLTEAIAKTTGLGKITMLKIVDSWLYSK